LNWIHISLCLVAPWRESETPLERRASAKLPQSTSPMLVYRMENKMPLIHHVVEQQECGCIIKDDENLNERTQRHPMMKPISKLMEVGCE
jgi:hypothetical protein